jgi:outer membrane protein assembly factor BamB
VIGKTIDAGFAKLEEIQRRLITGGMIYKPFTAAPAITNGRVYNGSGNTPLFYCLDAFTGKPLWIHRLGQRVEEATLCIYRNKVIVLAGDG